MNINPEYDLKYEELFAQIKKAKDQGLDASLNIYKEAGFGLGVIKTNNGKDINPILATDHSDPLRTTEDALKSGIFILTMAFAANEMKEMLNHPKFEKCVVEALDKIPLFIDYVKFKENIRTLDSKGEDRN